MPLISVVLPTFNRSKLLAKAIASLHAQTFGDFEVIVVDDGSTDDTPAVVAQCARTWPEGALRALRQANAGQGTARNLGIDHARGEYCVFLDSDDLLFPWSLETIANAIAGANSPPLLLGTESRFRDEAEFAAVRPRPLGFTVWPDLYAFWRHQIIRGAGETIARTSLLREAGGFLTERVVGEDTDLLLRLGVVPGMVKIDAPVTYGYRMHGEMFTAGSTAAYRGMCTLIRRCRQGAYPGAPARTRELQTLIARLAAFQSMRYLMAGVRRESVLLCAKTLSWQFAAGHYGYLWRFPHRVILSALGVWPLRRIHRRPLGAEG